MSRRAIVCPAARREMNRRGIAGRTVCTAAIMAQGPLFLLRAAEAVARQEIFTTDSDPYRDHAFGTVMVQGRKILWKIDLHGPDMVCGSPRPHDPAYTYRILTVFLADEY